MATLADLGNSLDLVDIKEIKESTVVGNDGGFRQIIMVGGVNFALKSDAEQNIMTQAYQNFLNSIDFPLQVVIHSRKVNIEKYTDDLLKKKILSRHQSSRTRLMNMSSSSKGSSKRTRSWRRCSLWLCRFIHFLP